MSSNGLRDEDGKVKSLDEKRLGRRQKQNPRVGLGCPVLHSILDRFIKHGSPPLRSGVRSSTAIEGREGLEGPEGRLLRWGGDSRYKIDRLIEGGKEEGSAHL